MKKISLKSIWSVAILALAVLVIGGIGTKVTMPVYATGPACYYDGDLDTWTCDLNAQCTATAGCDCYSSHINSGDFCTLSTPCNFNGANFFSGQTTTGYKNSTGQFGSCDDVTNHQIIMCQSDSSWTPIIGIFLSSVCTDVAPNGGYCDIDGTCGDTNRCNTPGGCDCYGATTVYKQQCHLTCAASGANINTHIYTVPSLWYGSSAIITTGVSIPNGTITYTQQFICSLGSLSATGSEGSGASCAGSYTRNGTACVYAGGGGGGGGGGFISTCGVSDLMCVNNIYQKKPGIFCQGGNLSKVCGTGIITTGNVVPLTGSIIGSPYSAELNNAYLRSYANGITTMKTIQQANMTSHLLRAHMAKMISNFAIRLGGLTPNTAKQCSFDDIASQSTEMKFYIKLACQLGLMGVGVDSFDPKGEISRADFGTILSRVIRGTRYNGGTPYYAAHLNALKNAGIMTQISTPKMKELRGYVMLMLQRTYEGGFLTGN